MTFSEFSTHLHKLESTPSRNQMTELLAELFRATRFEEIGEVCYLLLGRVAPLYEAIEFGVAEKFMIRAIALAYGRQPEQVMKVYKKVGDLGVAAQQINEESGTKRHKNSPLREVFAKLTLLANNGGSGSQDKKITILAALLSQADALSARYLARIPRDKLR